MTLCCMLPLDMPFCDCFLWTNAFLVRRAGANEIGRKEGSHGSRCLAAMPIFPVCADKFRTCCATFFVALRYAFHCIAQCDLHICGSFCIN